MQLYSIVIVAIVLAADNLSYNLAPMLGMGDGAVAGLALGLPALLLLILWVVTIRGARRAIKRKTLRPVLLVNQWSRTTRWLIVASHAVVVIMFGWLDVLRHAMGDMLLIEQLVAILLPIVGIAATWWIDYPIEKRLRDAMLLSRLDRGASVHPMPRRLAFVWTQLRLQILPMLAPLLLIAGVGEIIRFAAQGIADEQLQFWMSEGATIVSAACIFIIAPLLARVLLSVRRLEDGALREMLLDVCRAHRVKVREVLVWDTGGVMINAAVMGLVGRLRYILMTDALLEAMDRPQLLAVMAHEIGHARKHHMPWMVVTLLATLVLASLAVATPLMAWAWYTGKWQFQSSIMDMSVTLVALAIALVMFGWICRRFERQADTFAVVHLSEYGPAANATIAIEHADKQGDVEAEQEKYNGRVTATAVNAMQSALQAVAQLNMIDSHRHSWRHGSIAWRQQYLQQLIGEPVNRLSIDRTVGWIKIAAAAVLVTAGSFQIAWTVLDGTREYTDASVLEAENSTLRATEGHGEGIGLAVVKD